MKEVFKGNKYNFQIFNFSAKRGKRFFSIKATHKQTRRTSFITTVNVILSEMNIPDISRFWETEWILSKREASNLIISAEKLLSDKKFIPYLEGYLDLDQKQSEWENYEKL